MREMTWRIALILKKGVTDTIDISKCQGSEKESRRLKCQNFTNLAAIGIYLMIIANKEARLL